MFELGFSFALGALTLGLLALALVPALSRRAMRLATARARLLAPLDEKAAQAERDALRADHAVAASRFERRIMEAGRREGLARAELGRESVRLALLGVERDRLGGDVAAQRGEIAELSGERDEAAANLAGAQVALLDFSAQADRAAAQWADASRRMIALEASADRDRAHRAALETQGQALRLQLDDINARLARTHALAERRAGEIAALAGQHDEAMRQGAALVKALEAETLERERGQARIAALSAELTRLRAVHEDTLIDGARRLAEIAQRDGALRNMAERHLAFQGGVRGREQDLAQAAESAAASRAAAEGALAVSRQSLFDLQRQIASQVASQAASASGDAGLRAAIARLGAQIEGLARPPAVRKPRGGAASFRPGKGGPPHRDEGLSKMGARAYSDETPGHGA